MSRADAGSYSDTDIEHNAGADDPADHEGRLAPFRRPPTPPACRCIPPPSWRRLSPGERADYDAARRGYHADLPLVNTPTIQKVISTSRLLVQLNRKQVSARRGGDHLRGVGHGGRPPR